MKTIYIVHGCADDAKDRAYNKQWMPWLKRELTSKGLSVETPHMPTSWQPNYSSFRKVFDEYTISEEDTLIGHSCGAAFLVHWLGDTKQKIERLILVAPWKITDMEDPFRKEFYGYDIEESIKSRVKEVIIFTSDNEIDSGKKSAEIFHKALGGKVIELKGRGHYNLDDMGTEEFPELRDIVLE